MSAVAGPGSSARPQWRAFRAVLRRDLYVTWRELPAFLAQVILQPLFLLFVFGKVLGQPQLHAARLRDLLFPGLLALTSVITAMQTLAFPLVAEFGWTKEIEDRLMAPMPTSFVAAEKVLFALLRSFAATLIMLPIGDPDPRLDPVALERLSALRRRPRARSARRRRLRPADGDARAAAADQPALLARLHAAALHRAAASTRGRRSRGCAGSRSSPPRTR